MINKYWMTKNFSKKGFPKNNRKCYLKNVNKNHSIMIYVEF